MARTTNSSGAGRKPGGLTAWVNRTLFPWIGPPPLGPYTDEPEAEVRAAKAQSVCPMCGELMSVHEIDRSGERTQIYHPTPEQAAERRAALEGE
ncbi:hypothetical protein GCM10022381_29510 [Leifsonia kafniensis]|uniref:Uncharacterized protein n=1 Tax=Leifsonia kafniensis TaxID=475957 RepID=A0ABP7KTD1_9MICO